MPAVAVIVATACLGSWGETWDTRTSELHRFRCLLVPSAAVAVVPLSGHDSPCRPPPWPIRPSLLPPRHAAVTLAPSGRWVPPPASLPPARPSGRQFQRLLVPSAAVAIVPLSGRGSPCRRPPWLIRPSLRAPHHATASGPVLPLVPASSLGPGSVAACRSPLLSTLAEGGGLPPAVSMALSLAGAPAVGG
uniref:Uncharacterized protein n=1 Tax=Sphaerodactylus townsendi TaxID=933632 RepID=A0ACB8G9W3_9SAUR